MPDNINTPNYVFGTLQDGRMGSGSTNGKGLSIRWHEGGPYEQGSKTNGAQTTDVIEAVMQRVRHFQDNDLYACRNNQDALYHLAKAQELLMKPADTASPPTPSGDGPYR
jgi:hypothetical protein